MVWELTDHLTLLFTPKRQYISSTGELRLGGLTRSGWVKIGESLTSDLTIF